MSLGKLPRGCPASLRLRSKNGWEARTCPCLSGVEGDRCRIYVMLAFDSAQAPSGSPASLKLRGKLPGTFSARDLLCLWGAEVRTTA